MPRALLPFRYAVARVEGRSLPTTTPPSSARRPRACPRVPRGRFQGASTTAEPWSALGRGAIARLARVVLSTKRIMRLPLSLLLPLVVLGAASLGAAACAGKTDATCSGASCNGSSDLTGTWDLVATSPSGAPETGTMILAKDSLSLDLGTTQLTYTATGSSLSVTWSHDGTTSSIATQRTPAALDLGIVPLDVGGTWAFSSPSRADACQADLTQPSWTGGCDVYVAGWPSALPEPVPGVHYVATRTQTLDSAFGDLGGVWTASDGRGGPGSCVVTFQGSDFSAACNGAAGSLNGTVQLTFAGTTSASGTTSHGFELSAHRQ